MPVHVPRSSLISFSFLYLPKPKYLMCEILFRYKWPTPRGYLPEAMDQLFQTMESDVYTRLSVSLVIINRLFVLFRFSNPHPLDPRNKRERASPTVFYYLFSFVLKDQYCCSVDCILSSLASFPCRLLLICLN